MSKSEIRIYTPEDCKADMLYDLEHGQPKGTTTYIESFDNAWTWRKSEANVWTGMANEGKSLFMKFLCIIKSLEENWKFTFNSPEDFPPKTFFDDCIHTISGMTTDKFNTFNEVISKELYLHCLDKIKNNFKFLYIKPPNNTIENSLEQFQKLHDENPQDGFILDPLMKFQKSKDAPDRIEDYITYVVTLLTDFARVNNISLHLIIHQLTPKIIEGTGLYQKPSMYTIRGGGSVADGIDNVMFVQRPLYAKDKLATDVLIGSQKIKKQKLTGIPQDLKFNFNRKTNRYVDEAGLDLYNFNKWLPNYKTKINFLV
jgi:twinkle protein